MAKDPKHYTPQQLIDLFCNDASFRSKVSHGIFRMHDDSIEFYPVIAPQNAAEDILEHAIPMMGLMRRPEEPLRFTIDFDTADFINLDNPLPYSFPESLSLLMKIRGESNESLAEACNLSSKTISRLRNRETDPSKENVVALCIGLNLDPYIGHQLLDRAGRSLSGDEVGRAYDFLMGLAMGIDINEANEMLEKMDLPKLGNDSYR